MAFDMYAGDRKDKIDYHEEPLFKEISENYEEFPLLNEIWENFYDGPRFNPSQSNQLTHELLSLSESLSSNPDLSWLHPIVIRLACFFSFACVNQLEVKCVSD